MESNRIQIKGLVRNRARNEFQDGECQEVINLRFRDNAWRTVGEPSLIQPGSFSNQYKAIWLHVQDGIRNYIALTPDFRLMKIDIEEGTQTLIKEYESDVSVESLKRFLIVTGNETDIFIYRNGQYSLVSVDVYPDAVVSTKTVQITTTNWRTTADALLGEYRNKIYTLSRQGYLTGSFAFRFAWRLYDGSFIKHTIPQIYIMDNESIELRKLSPNYRFQQIYSYIPEISIPDPSLYNSIDDDLFVSLCLFLSPVEDYFQIDSDSITTELISGLSNTTHTLESINIPVNVAREKLTDSMSWHLVHEITTTELKTTYNKTVDVKGFLIDFATRQRLTVDSFSHHKLSGDITSIYNDRLIISSTKTKLSEFNQKLNTLPSVPSGYTQYFDYDGYFRVTLKTETGEKIIYKPSQFRVVQKDTKYYVLFRGNGYTVGGNTVYQSLTTIGYPDARATKIDILNILIGEYGGQTFNLTYVAASLTLKKSMNDNFAYYEAERIKEGGFYLSNYILVEVSVSGVGDPIIVQNNDTLLDENRVQISELQNPFVFPARNSYQVGTGQILAISANTEPLSTGQFGQYPLMVFTSKGIWAMEQGQGDVIFASISPVSGEVVLDKDQVISVGSGVVFTTKRGLFLITGKQIIELSNLLEGQINTDFIDNNHFEFFCSNSKLVELYSNLSRISSNDYILNSKIGFDKINSELIVTDSTKNYSYVYNFESNTWHKITRTYSYFVNDYPNLIGVNESGMVSISLESFNNSIDTLLLTQPQSFNQLDVYKKIERIIMRSSLSLENSKHFTFALWASNDLKTWQLITGKQLTGYIKNMMIQRSHVSAQYFVLMMAGNINSESSIPGIDVSFTPKLNLKLRK